MPRTGTLLAEKERASFALWLRQRIAASPLRPMEIAERLGDESTARLNRYTREENPQLPTPLVLAKLAAAIDVRWPVAFLYAGHFAEFLGELNRLAGAARGKDRRIIIELALEAFPRRDVRPSSSFTASEAAIEFEYRVARGLKLSRSRRLSAASGAPTATSTKARMRGLNPFFVRASLVLRDATLSPATRRFIAAEYVNAWADDYDPAIARELREGQGKAQRLADALRDRGVT